MDSPHDNYLLEGGSAELERLCLQARVWEPETEALLDRIGLKPRWNCVDLGCGAMGLLSPLNCPVGPEGRVMGVETDAKQLAAAYDFVKENKLNNVEILEQDAFHTNLQPESFDFTHGRFLFGPVGRDEELLQEMPALTRPGGIIAIQEPDTTSWNCYPNHPPWELLKVVILTIFARGRRLKCRTAYRSYSPRRRA